MAADIIIFFYIIAIFVAIAFWEAYIEGSGGWAANQVGWKLNFKVGFLKRPIDAYHFWRNDRKEKRKTKERFLTPFIQRKVPDTFYLTPFISIEHVFPLKHTYFNILPPARKKKGGKIPPLFFFFFFF